MLFTLVFLLTIQLWLVREKQRLMLQDGMPVEGELPRRKGLRYAIEEAHFNSSHQAQHKLDGTPNMTVPDKVYANDPMLTPPR